MAIDERTLAPGLSLRTRNLAASAAVVAVATAAFTLAPHNHAAMTQLYGPPAIAFTGYRFMAWAAVVYVLLLAGYYFTAGEGHVSKSLRFWRLLARWAREPRATLRGGIEREERVAALSTLLKAFFGPIMVKSLMFFCINAWINGSEIVAAGITATGFAALFNQVGYWFLLQVILFVDVFFFTVGYLVESRRLGNEIRSVDPTLVGWGAALLCYPPFNYVTGKLLGSTVSDFPQFDDPNVHLALNLALLTLMAIYASASAALGLKASNLTHRGIVARGPYAVVRHPAYVCKNAAWWIGSVPLIVAAFHQSWFEGLQAFGSMAAWTSLYALRALTEEDHLRSVDGEYAAYAARVRYRFIPGVY